MMPTEIIDTIRAKEAERTRLSTLDAAVVQAIDALDPVSQAACAGTLPLSVSFDLSSALLALKRVRDTLAQGVTP